MEPIEGSKFCAETGFHTEKPENFIRYYDVEDADSFIAHMRKYHSIPESITSREQYEKVCAEYRVIPMDDQEIKTSYGVEFGVFDGHYHIDESLRTECIMMTIAQRYKKAIPQVVPEVKEEPEAEIEAECGGQIWEPCECCGAEPSYLPYHLCEKCR
jgi:hypothetical protein